MKVWDPLLWLGLLSACGAGEEPPAAASSALPPGVLARVGHDAVATETVARLYHARGLTAEAAGGLAISDAIWAGAARDRLPRGSSRVIEQSAVARALLETLHGAAQAEGPPTRAELEAIVEQRWLQLARPEAARTTHVVVLNDHPERDAEARQQAEKLALALHDVKSSEELLRIGRAFSSDGFEIRAEALGFVVPDGRTFQRYGEGFVPLADIYDPDFTRAALALDRPGQLSPVVKSKFGYHVMRLDERLPASIVPASELETLLAPEVWAQRAVSVRRELIERLRRGAAIQYERAADDLTARVKTSP